MNFESLHTHGVLIDASTGQPVNLDDAPPELRTALENLFGRGFDPADMNGGHVEKMLERMRKEAVIERGPFFAIHSDGKKEIGNGEDEPISFNTYDVPEGTIEALIDARTAAELAECDLEEHINQRRRQGINQANEAMHQRMAGYKPSIGDIASEMVDVIGAATAEFVPAKRTRETYHALCRSTHALITAQRAANEQTEQAWNHNRAARRRLELTGDEVLQWMVVNRRHLLFPDVGDEAFRDGVAEYVQLTAEADLSTPGAESDANDS